MKYNFDEILDKRGTTSGKWCEVKDGGWVPDGAIPMFVAEMDYQLAPVLKERLLKRVQTMIFGYDHLPKDFYNHVIQHYHDKFNVHVEKEWIVNVPSIMASMNMACKMLGGTLFYNSPMYSHIRALTHETKQNVIEVPLGFDGDKYYMDLNKMEEMITDDVHFLILCNPHNPVGRMYTQEELEGIVAFCKKHDLVLISDEIHCELSFDRKHIPAFGINEDSLKKSITFNSCGKILNIPGLPSAIAIIPDEELRNQFIEYTEGMFPFKNTVAWEGLDCNYDGSCDDWKDEVRAYLKDNRDLLEERVKQMPLVSMAHVEGTYLAWLDCTQLGDQPRQFFLDKCNVFFNDGEEFGNKQFVRINFACTRKQLVEVCDKMEAALTEFQGNQK